MDLLELIKKYYYFRNYKWPNFDDAMKFVATEIAEVYELDLARKGGWVRNNPDEKSPYTKEAMAQELGDAIMMLLVAGIVEGVDPLQALVDKINYKMSKEANSSVKQATLFAEIVEIS